MLLALWPAYFSQDVVAETPRRIFGGSWVEHKPRNTYQDDEEIKDDVLDIISELRTPETESEDIVSERVIEAGNISDIFTPVAAPTQIPKVVKTLPELPTSEIIGTIENSYASEYLLLLSY